MCKLLALSQAFALGTEAHRAQAQNVRGIL